MKCIDEYLENVKRSVIIADNEKMNRDILGKILALYQGFEWS